MKTHILSQNLAIAGVCLFGFGCALSAAESLPGTAPRASFSWTTSGPLVLPTADANHSIVAVKDPSIVFHDGRWHIFATTAGSNGWGMAYFNFANWDAAPKAKPLWVEGISHGELLREGSDETMTVDPQNVRFLYQGLPVGKHDPNYVLLPYRVGLLKLASHR